MEKNIDIISKWANENGMHVNSNKCAIVSFNKNKNLCNYQYTINMSVIPSVDHVKYLGLNFSADLTWSHHICKIVAKANRSLHFVVRNLRHANKQVKCSAYLTLVRPLLEYCSSVWDPHQQYLIDKIESVQRKAARYVCK